MLKTLTNMSYGESSDTSVKKNGELFFEHYNLQVLMAKLTKIFDDISKDMLVDAQLIPDAFRVPIQQLKNPHSSCKRRCMIYCLVVCQYTILKCRVDDEVEEDDTKVN